MRLSFWLLGIAFLSLGLGWAEFARAASENLGLGPLEIRDQFPVGMPFLSMAPETPGTLGHGRLSFSYQMAMANSFVNSEGGNGRIREKEIQRGLLATDFFNEKTGLPIEGFSSYIDVESYRHTFRLKYGLFDSLDLGLELPYFSFVGGSFDETIESFHTLVGIDNKASQGAYRSLSPRNRYDYYLLHKDYFLISSQQPFENVLGELTLHLKWKLWEGSSVLPATAFKVSYKFGAQHRNKQQKLIASGQSDVGHYLLFSKGYGDWVVYLGWGASQLNRETVLATRLWHRFMTMEYKLGSELSLILQVMSQSSIFPTGGNLRGSSQEQSSADLTRATDVVVLGYKQRFDEFFVETGFVEDYNQAGNATDIVLYFEVGQTW